MSKLHSPTTATLWITTALFLNPFFNRPHYLWRPGLINVDFADVRTIMGDAGTALMGIGRGSGEKWGVENKGKRTDLCRAEYLKQSNVV